MLKRGKLKSWANWKDLNATDSVFFNFFKIVLFMEYFTIAKPK